MFVKGPRSHPRYHRRGSGWVPVGPPVFKTGDAALGGVVGSTPTRSRHGAPMSSKPAIRPRPRASKPSSSGCARASTVSIPMLSPPWCARPSTRSGRTRRQAWIPATRCPRRRRPSPPRGSRRHRADPGHQRHRRHRAHQSGPGVVAVPRGRRDRPPIPGAAAARTRSGDRRRGQRARIAEDHLVALTGAEDALVTNNNAAALALAVGLVGRGGVVVSRGELVEIGGGVRSPRSRRAGAKLIEVGTTNRTRTADFEGPLREGTAKAVLRVHPRTSR